MASVGERDPGGQGRRRATPAACRWAGVLVAGVLLASPARGQVPGDTDDVAMWIGKACPGAGGRPGAAPGTEAGGGAASFEAMVRLDQVAGKAVMDELRRGAFRESVRAAAAYLACWDAQGTLQDQPLFRPRLASLRQLVCFVPLVVFESEGRVDPALAALALDRCPEPGERPAGKDAVAVRRWAEDVRRHLHLVAACRAAPEVLDGALSWLGRMRDAGIVGADGTATWPGTATAEPEAGKDGAAEGQEGDGEEADPEGGESSGPDPVFAVRVLAAGAAVAAGDLPRLLQAFGGEEEACRSPFLAALGFLQAVDLPQTAALPLILKALVARSDLARMADLSDRVSKRFEGRPCAAQAMVSSLVLGSLPAAATDAAVAAGKADLVARVAVTAPAVVPVRGVAPTRIAVLEAVVGRVAGDARAERLCQLGVARLESGDDAGALADFDRVAAAGEGKDPPACAVEGRLRARVTGGRTGDGAFPASVAAWLAGGPAAVDVLARVLEPGDDGRRAAAVAAFAAAVREPAAPGRDAVLEALVKVVDDEPGTASARAAVTAVEAAGWPREASERVTWDLVRGRHHVVAAEDREARAAFDRAFRGLGQASGEVRGGVAALLRWSAGDRRYRWLDDLLPRARRAGVLTSGLVAELAAMIAEVGERARARRLLAVARALKPASPAVWVSLADASARMDDVDAALRDLRRAGPEADWGPDAFQVKGRIETARGRHRDAVAAYARAVEAEPGACEPRFFRGLALLLVGDPESAEADFLACLKTGNRGSQVRGALGYALFDQSRLEESQRTFAEALVDDDASADNHLGLALARLRLGDREGALKSWRAALVREPAFGKGLKAAGVKGYIYSEVQKKAFEDLVRAAGGPGGKR